MKGTGESKSGEIRYGAEMDVGGDRERVKVERAPVTQAKETELKKKK